MGVWHPAAHAGYFDQDQDGAQLCGMPGSDFAADWRLRLHASLCFIFRPIAIFVLRSPLCDVALACFAEWQMIDLTRWLACAVMMFDTTALLRIGLQYVITTQDLWCCGCSLGTATMTNTLPWWTYNQEHIASTDTRDEWWLVWWGFVSPHPGPYFNDDIVMLAVRCKHNIGPDWYDDIAWLLQCNAHTRNFDVAVACPLPSTQYIFLTSLWACAPLLRRPPPVQILLHCYLWNKTEG